MNLPSGSCLKTTEQNKETKVVCSSVTGEWGHECVGETGLNEAR